MKAAIHFGPDFLTNSEIYTNTKFENIWSVSNSTRKLMKEHSEEILNVECPENVSPSWTRSWPMIKKSSGRRQKYVSTLILFFVSDRWNMLQEQQKDGKAKLKISRSSSYLDAEDFVIFSFSRDPERLGDKRTSSQKTSRTGSSSLFMFNDIERKKNDEIFRMPKKSGRQQNGTAI